jgi:hypothetical protein
MWNIDGMAKFLARALVAAFILATIPGLAILADAPVAMAQMSAHTLRDSVGPDGCTPMGLTTHSDGTV